MKTLRIPSLILIALFVCACGIDRGGITQTNSFAGSVVAGKIDSVRPGTNSIVIDGQEQSLQSTNILINGVAANSSQLTVGLFAVATTSATGLPGQPERLEINLNVAGGEITEGTSSDTIVQFGQSIVLDALNVTVPVADLTVPGVSNFAFSGYIKASGEIDATATIAYPVDGPPLITGIARNVDSNLLTFSIGSQTINYAQAMVISTLTGSITENSLLRIELTSNTSGETIDALSIAEVPLVDTSLGENTLVSVSGYYAAAPTNTSFSILNQTVVTDANTVFENTQLAALNFDSLLLIEGVLTANGAVLAHSVRQLN